jgi:hypothetical protein
MTATFGKAIVTQMSQTAAVWMDDANYKDYSGTATFTASETKVVTDMLSRVGTLFQSIKADTINGISKDPDLLMLVKTYNNTKVRAGERIQNPRMHVQGLFHWIYEKFQKEIESKKTEKGKSVQEEKRKKILAYFANHAQDQIAKVFELSNLIADIKSPIIAKMNQAGHIPTFIKTKNGFKTTGVEGFVAIDHLRGGAVKIVDRMEFSSNNFNPEIIKGWQR